MEVKIAASENVPKAGQIVSGKAHSIMIIVMTLNELPHSKLRGSSLILYAYLAEIDKRFNAMLQDDNDSTRKAYVEIIEN